MLNPEDRMKKGLSRRDFLRLSAATVVARPY
ncbi:MAG: twin-arginine translocation signal domain-containing protein [Anaerolineae bacterium]|nr:twin-arginine translocation signal domain-containing protein [Anaerolineae bacterium]